MTNEMEKAANYGRFILGAIAALKGAEEILPEGFEWAEYSQHITTNEGEWIISVRRPSEDDG